LILHRLNHRIEVLAGLFRKDAIHQLGEDDRVNPFAVRLRRGDWSSLESVKKYAKVETAARKALLEKKIIKLPVAGSSGNRDSISS
jgi:hypothetical protein